MDIQPAKEDMRTRAFLSYSRKDTALVVRLADGLTGAGFLADFDQAAHDPGNVSSGISAEDEWWKRLQEMIAAADVTVFLVSPDSAASAVCDEEIAYARALGKRIIAVLARAVDFAKAPPRLSALNVRIDFSESGPGFDAALAGLVAALETNVGWHREGRKYYARVQEWDTAGRPKSRLLREGAVEEAERWAVTRPRGEPEPGELFLAWLAASRAQIKRDAAVRAFWRRVTAVFVFTTLAATMLGAWRVIDGQRNLGRSESLMLARTADQLFNEGDYLRALHMAILASRESFFAPSTDEAEAVFAKSAQALRLVSAIDIVPDPSDTPAMIAEMVPLAQDTRLLIMDQYGRLSLWDAVTGAQLVAPVDSGVWTMPEIHVDRSRAHALAVWSSMAYLFNAEEGTARQVAIPADTLPSGLAISDISSDGQVYLLSDKFENELNAYDTGSGALIYTLKTDTPVLTARFEINGAAIATREAHTYQVWDSGDGTLIHRLADLIDPAIGNYRDGVHLSPDGGFIIADSERNRAQVFDLSAGTVVAEITGHAEYLDEVLFVPELGRVILKDGEGSLHLVSATNFERIGEPVISTDPLKAQNISAGHGLFLSRSLLGEVSAWSLLTGEQMRSETVAGREANPDAYAGMRFVPNTHFVLAWDERATLAIRTDESGSDTVQLLDEHPGFIEDVVVAPDGRSFLTFSSEAQARQWDVVTGIQIGGPWPSGLAGAGSGYTGTSGRILTAYEDRAWFWQAQEQTVSGGRKLSDGTPVMRSFLSPGGSYQVAVSEAGQAQLRRVPAGEPFGAPILMGQPEKSGLAFDPAGKLLAVWYDTAVQMVDLDTGEAGDLLIRNGGAIEAGQFSPDGRRFVTLDFAQVVRVWDPYTGELIGAPASAELPIMPPFSPDGQRMLVWSGMAAQLIDLGTGTPVAEEMMHAVVNDPGGGSAGILGGEFSADGTTLVTWSDDEVRVWDGETGTLLAGPIIDGGGPLGATVSADGKRILVLYLAFARLYDGSKSGPAGKEIANGREARWGVLSADGDLAVTWGDDGYLHLWDAEAGHRIGNPVPVDMLGQTVTFSADGLRVLAVDDLGTFRILDTLTGDLLAQWVLPNSAPGHVWTANASQVLATSQHGEIHAWDTVFAAETGLGADRIAMVCAAKLGATGVPKAQDVSFLRQLDTVSVFRAPILRGREGEDVCTPSPAPWWELAAGMAFGWAFK